MTDTATTILYTRKGFPCGSLVKNLPAKQDTWVWSQVLEDSPGEGNGNPLQYSCLAIPMDLEGPVNGVTRVRHDLVTTPKQYIHERTEQRKFKKLLQVLTRHTSLLKCTGLKLNLFLTLTPMQILF